jgi:hypothetical protein
MRKLTMTLIAAAALALPTAAFAHDGNGSGGHHFGFHHHGGGSALFTKVSGTGASFSLAGASVTGTFTGSPLASGTVSATLATNWAQSTTKTSDHGTLVCAPSTATVVLTDSAASANTSTGTLTGKTCSFTKTDGTIFRGFFGKGTVTGTGTLAALTGDERAFLSQKSDGTVSGAVFAGVKTTSSDKTMSHDSLKSTQHSNSLLSIQFKGRQDAAAHKTGNCDH